MIRWLLVFEPPSCLPGKRSSGVAGRPPLEQLRFGKKGAGAHAHELAHELGQLRSCLRHGNAGNGTEHGAASRIGGHVEAQRRVRGLRITGSPTAGWCRRGCPRRQPPPLRWAGVCAALPDRGSAPAVAPS